LNGDLLLDDGVSRAERCCATGSEMSGTGE
jgi:hypothetical protein